MKSSGEQIDDRIVEVHWDPDGENWRMMRFRDDKPHGNHRNVVENIIQSIADGVERDAVRTFVLHGHFASLRHHSPAAYTIRNCVFELTATFRWCRYPFRTFLPLACLVPGTYLTCPAQLLARSNGIKNAWKARQSQRAAGGGNGAAPAKPPPPPAAHPPPPASSAVPKPDGIAHPLPHVAIRYGPLASSPYSKVGGPAIVAGMHR